MGMQCFIQCMTNRLSCLLNLFCNYKWWHRIFLFFQKHSELSLNPPAVYRQSQSRSRHPDFSVTLGFPWGILLRSASVLSSWLWDVFAILASLLSLWTVIWQRLCRCGSHPSHIFPVFYFFIYFQEGWRRWCNCVKCQQTLCKLPAASDGVQ